MGLDIFTIDDGWQAEYGDNTVNTKAFPGGLDEVVQLAERQHMGLGLWSALAAISTKSAVYREHPEWVAREADGQPKFASTASGQCAVMCLASAYRKLDARRISDLISRYHLQYLKIDLTTVFNTYGESPGCHASGHDHATWEDSLDRIYEGIQEVTDTIYREHPDVLLDLTFELWGQKHVIDYGLLGAGDLDWLSNVDDHTPESAGPGQARRLLHHRSLAIPVETMLIGNLRANSAPIEERLAIMMGSGPMCLGDLRQLTPEQQGWYRERIRWFKSFRKAVPFNGSFFSLGNWAQPGSAHPDGFARFSRQGQGVIVVFRDDSPDGKLKVEIPTLPDGAYCVRSEITGKSLGNFSGEQLQRGLEVQVPDEHKVEVLEISK